MGSGRRIARRARACFYERSLLTGGARDRSAADARGRDGCWSSIGARSRRHIRGAAPAFLPTAAARLAEKDAARAKSARDASRARAAGPARAIAARAARVAASIRIAQGLPLDDDDETLETTLGGAPGGRAEGLTPNLAAGASRRFFTLAAAEAWAKPRRLPRGGGSPPRSPSTRTSDWRRRRWRATSRRSSRGGRSSTP